MEYKSFHDILVKHLIDLVKMHRALYHLGHMVWDKFEKSLALFRNENLNPLPTHDFCLPIPLNSQAWN